MENQETITTEKKSPWKDFGSAIFMFAVGIGFYFFFDYLEKEGEGARMNAIIVLLYELFGKSGLLYISFGFGLIYLWFGINTLRKNKAQ
ncbi:MAG: hypothetical protein ACO3EE_08345 [Flavobacteriales bacterium]